MNTNIYLHITFSIFLFLAIMSNEDKKNEWTSNYDIIVR